MNPSITTEQMQEIESALRIYWAGGEPDTTPSMEWLRSYLDLNGITTANFARLVAQIHQHTLGSGQNVQEETRKWAVQLMANELNDLSEHASQQSISDPVWLRENLKRAGVIGDVDTVDDESLSLLASALDQTEIRQRVFGEGGPVGPNANDVIGLVDTLRGMMAAAQNVREEGASFTVQDGLSLGVIATEQGITASQLSRLNAVLEGRRGESNEAYTFNTLVATVESVIALDKKITGATDAVDLTLDDFERLGIKGVTVANLAVVNQQLSDENLLNSGGGGGGGGVQQGGALDNPDLAQSVVDQQLIEAMTVVITAIHNQQTAALTLQDYVHLGLVLPAEFDVDKFNTLLLSHETLGNAYPAYSLGQIGHLQQLANVSHKMTLLSDNQAANDTVLSADDFEVLSSVAQLGMAGYDEQAQSLFNDVLKSSAQRSPVIFNGETLSGIAHTISDLHRLASGGRAKATLSNERLEQIGLVAEGGQPLSDTTIKALVAVVARTESSGAGVDALAKLNAMVSSYQSVLNLADGTANNSNRPTQAQFAALRINGVDSDLKAQLLGDLLDRKAANEVDSLSKLQGLAQVVNQVVAYAAGAQVNVTQADLERLGLQGLNEQRTASVLDQLRSHGADGSKIGQISQIQAMVYWPEITALSLSSDTGTPGDWITKDATQTITATLSQTLMSGMTVLGSVDGGLTWTDITNKVSGNSIQWTQANLLTGNHSIRFKWQDAEANEGFSASTSYTLDNVGPTQSIDQVRFSADSGASSTDLITTQASQTVTATLSAALGVGESLQASLDGGNTWTRFASTGAARLDGTSLNWSGVQLMTGARNIQFRLEDVAGNTSTAVVSYTLDTTSPTQTVSNVLLGSDNGRSTTDRITSQQVQTITGTLSAALAAGESLYGTVDGGLNWSNITQYVNGTGVNWAGAQLLVGTQNISFKVQDLAGNEKSSANTSYTLDTTAATSTVSATANGAVAVFAPADAYTYTVTYTNESNIEQTVTVTKSGSTWSATGVPTGSAVLASTGTLRLNNDHVLDGSTVTVATRDTAGNVGLSTTVAAADTASQAGNPIIDLGSYGRLMAPVQVEGKWYYTWDIDGSGAMSAGDRLSMLWFESTFFGNSTGTAVTESNRSFTVNGVQLKVPIGGKDSYLSGTISGTAYSAPIDDPVLNSNTKYDDLVAIWDAFNGTGTGTIIDGTPPGWTTSAGGYSAATEQSHSNYIMGMSSGTIGATSDDGTRYFALQVL